MKSLIVLTLSTALALVAQPQFGRRPAPGGRGAWMGGGESALTRTVSGAPYSAVEVRESTQTLSNGNVINHKTESNVYRDSSGRVRVETTVQPRRTRNGQTAGGQTSTDQPHVVATIRDPVAGVTRELNSATKTSRETPMPRARGRAAADGTGAGRGDRPAPTASSNPNLVRETLPMQTINGVQATGVRVTHTIPAGQNGNAQAMQSIHEVWTSPDLKVPVMTKDVDPRTGTHITQLTNIIRTEPDPSLFQAPADYQVVQVHARAGRGR